ncbi:MAG: right-handed parallel beta-helix repeat-containing protein [Cellvibrionaceae bacterium]
MSTNEYSKLVKIFLLHLIVTTSMFGPTFAFAQAAAPNCVPITRTPLSITEPGTYCLTQHTLVSQNGISIQANDVTIDLNGYALRSVRAGQPDAQTFGIYSVVSDGWNLTVKNGTIAGFAAAITLVRVSNVRIENVKIDGDATQTSTTGIGIYNSTGPVVVRDNEIANVGFGIRVNAATATIERNTIQMRTNAATGIGVMPVGVGGTFVGANAVVSGNMINGSGSAGTGISFSATGLVTDNVVTYVATGISSNSGGGRYRNNVVIGATRPYSLGLGVDLGGND